MEKQVVSSLWLVGHAVLAYYRNGSGPCTHSTQVHNTKVQSTQVHNTQAHSHTYTQW